METTLVQAKSTHECPVFMFDFGKVEKHFNADKLGLHSLRPKQSTMKILVLALLRLRGSRSTRV